VDLKIINRNAPICIMYTRKYFFLGRGTALLRPHPCGEGHLLPTPYPYPR